MTPNALKEYLQKLVEHRIPLSTMIWGPPGIGKSSIVNQVATAMAKKYDGEVGLWKEYLSILK